MVPVTRMGAPLRASLLLGAALLSSGEPKAPPSNNCRCNKEPHYELPQCPPGAFGCMNVLNKCGFSLWPVVAVGSPPTIEFMQEVPVGQSLQWVFPAQKGSAWGGGGRIYFYYRNPANLPGFPHGSLPLSASSLPQAYAQLFEFVLDWDPQAGRHFLDVDVSQVDRAALPLYAYGGNNCGGQLGRRCSNAECVKAYSACPASTFYEQCPCQGDSFAPEAGVGQCLAPGLFCNDPANANTPCCRTFNAPKYQAVVKGNNAPGAIYGCRCDQVDCRKCAAMNRGICSDPSDKSNCPVSAWDSPEHWYKHGLDQNSYAAWIHQTWNNSYGFSLDEGAGGGNTQCRHGTQLDIVSCPSCNKDGGILEVLV